MKIDTSFCKDQKIAISSLVQNQSFAPLNTKKSARWLLCFASDDIFRCTEMPKSNIAIYDIKLIQCTMCRHNFGKLDIFLAWVTNHKDMWFKLNHIPYQVSCDLYFNRHRNANRIDTKNMIIWYTSKHFHCISSISWVTIFLMKCLHIQHKLVLKYTSKVPQENV